MSVRDRAPDGAKRMGRRLSVGLARPTAQLRALPTVVIAGASRCGTTSLHRAMVTHPGLAPPVLHKGVHYFDVNYARDIRWYQSHFPLRSSLERRSRRIGHEARCFESSGYYMYHPQAPRRMAEDLPGLQAVVMLRDPVERAYSAFKHEHARGFEPEGSFERALELEQVRNEGEVERIEGDVGYVSVPHRHQSYVHRGQYAEQLARLFSLLGRENVHVLFSEEFFATPEQEYERLLAFLGLPVLHAPAYERHNARRSSPMAAATRDRLRRHFEPHDEALVALLGRIPPWRR